MVEANVMPASYINDSRIKRTKELELFMASDFAICELERFCKLLTSDYNEYVKTAYQIKLMDGQKDKSRIMIYTCHGILYAAKVKR